MVSFARLPIEILAQNLHKNENLKPKYPQKHRANRPYCVVQRQSYAVQGKMSSKLLVLQEKSGGRDRDRTCDPYHVKVVLFR